MDDHHGVKRKVDKTLDDSTLKIKQEEDDQDKCDRVFLVK